MTRKEKLCCVKCKKIIVEFDNYNKLKESLKDHKYIQCPYCSYIHLNPYN